MEAAIADDPAGGQPDRPALLNSALHRLLSGRLLLLEYTGRKTGRRYTSRSAGTTVRCCPSAPDPLLGHPSPSACGIGLPAPEARG